MNIVSLLLENESKSFERSINKMRPNRRPILNLSF